MKTVIVEVRGHLAVTLSEDGNIKRIKNENYEIGQVIDLKEQLKIRNRRFLNSRFIKLSASLAASLFMFLSVSAWAYYTPYSYVSLDVNPSIEYSINFFDRVLSVNALNDDGVSILTDMQLNNKNIDEAIKETIAQIAVDGYFDAEDTGGVMIAIYSKDSKKAEKMAEKLKGKVDDATASSGAYVEAISIGAERVQRAKELGVTPGKLKLIEKLQASAENPESIVTAEWLKKPVKQIMKTIKENNKAAKTVLNEEVAQDSIDEEENGITEPLIEDANNAITKQAEKKEQNSIRNEEKIEAKQQKEDEKEDEKEARQSEKVVTKQERDVEKEAENKIEKKADQGKKAEAKKEKEAYKEADKAEKVEPNRGKKK